MRVRDNARLGDTDDYFARNSTVSPFKCGNSLPLKIFMPSWTWIIQLVRDKLPIGLFMFFPSRCSECKSATSMLPFKVESLKAFLGKNVEAVLHKDHQQMTLPKIIKLLVFNPSPSHLSYALKVTQNHHLFYLFPSWVTSFIDGPTPKHTIDIFIAL